MRVTFEQQRDRDWTRLCAAADANLAHYVYDETGQCRGRCREHDRGEHHPLCPARQPVRRESP